MKTRILHMFLFLALICVTELGNLPLTIESRTANKSQNSGTSIKWAVIVMGGYNYYRSLTYNAIQRIEKIIQGRGVPYDLVPDVDIAAPTDNPPKGKYPLQFGNGSLKYQVFVMLLDWWETPKVVNQNYIYWAVGNGTNAVIFGRAAQVVPDLLGVTSDDIGFFWAHKNGTCVINKTFDDGVKLYDAGSVIRIGAPTQYHTILHHYTGRTFWFKVVWNADWSVGMINGTYFSGDVWFIQWTLNEYRMEDVALKYINTWGTQNFGFWAHAINFAFNNVEKIPVKIMPYKKWKGAWIIRFDTNHYMWEEYWLPPEAILTSGWTWDYRFSVLGFGRARGNHPLPLKAGAPDGYSGIPSSEVMHTDVTGVLQTLPRSPPSKDYKAIIYNSTVGGKYNQIKIDFNENMNFTDDTEYKLWENMTYSTVQGKLYWCSIIPNASQPKEINIAWWQTPMMFANESARERFKQYGHEYTVSYGVHGWQHTIIPTPEGGTYGVWNGTAFVHNATYIEQHFNAARYWMMYSFGPTGYGYEENEVIVSHPYHLHPNPTDSIVANLSWVLFSYAGRYGTGGHYWMGFAKKSATDKYELASSRIESFYTQSNFTIIQEIVQTLYPVISTYHHSLDEHIFNCCKSFRFPPYSNSIKPANPREAFHFWLNAKYLLEHTTNGYYKNGKIVLEFEANNTLKDFVWKFPIEYDGKYFNGFSDNRSIGKIKHFDGRYVYIEFNQGQGAQRVEVTYGSNPHLLYTSSYIENITQTYTAKNLTLHLWNASGSVNVNVNCTRLGQPDSIKNGATSDYNYNSTAKILSFNVTFDGLETVQLLWTHAPPNIPTLISPLSAKHVDPSKSVIFAWNFSDPDLGDFQCAYRFQLDDISDFRSPIIDTGKFVSNFTHITQTLPIAVGLYYWRVKTWDSQDAESDWSDDQAIIVDKLTVTITADTTNVKVGDQVNFKVTVYYAYNNEHVSAYTVHIAKDGVHFAVNNFTDICTTVNTHKYSVEKITETTHGLTAFASNSLTIMWKEEPFIKTLSDWIASNALIVLSAVESILFIFLLIRKRRMHANP